MTKDQAGRPGSGFVIRHSHARSGHKRQSMFGFAKSDSSFRTMSNQPPNRSEDEPTARDDAVTGRALRRSLVVLLLVGTLVAGVSFLLERKTPASQSPGEPESPTAPQAALNAVPHTLFTEVTRSAGVTFVHTNGAY